LRGSGPGGGGNTRSRARTRIKFPGAADERPPLATREILPKRHGKGKGEVSFEVEKGFLGAMQRSRVEGVFGRGEDLARKPGTGACRTRPTKGAEKGRTKPRGGKTVGEDRCRKKQAGGMQSTTFSIKRVEG